MSKAFSEGEQPGSTASEKKAASWHIITCEYPPQPGGVSDYTRLIATELAATGDEVHVWCPAGEQKSEVRSQRSDAAERLVVHRDLGQFSPADLRRVGKMLDDFPKPRRLLVQWVPQGYGYRSMNLPFCWWLWRRAKNKQDRVELMVHEPFLPFAEGSRKQDIAAAVHRLMMTILLRAASHVWVSIPDWEKQLKPLARGNKSFGWLPVPSNIPVVDDPEGVAKIRERYTSKDNPLIGHFGAYDKYMTSFMLKLLPPLMNGAHQASVILLGKGSRELREIAIDAHPELENSLHATGMLAAEDISRHISACDVMLQPYQDGVSGRRTSVMSALAHGVPVVATRGKATESCWTESPTIKLIDASDTLEITRAVHCLVDLSKRNGAAADLKTFYDEFFDVKRTISRLRKAAI